MGFDPSRVKHLVGKASGTLPALDAVSKSDLRHWCELIDEDNTPFHEVDWASRTAPPAMLMAWTMPPYWSPSPRTPSEPHELAMEALDEAGYACAVGIGLDQVFHHSVQVGDRLSYSVRLDGVSSEEVDTPVGKGFQVDLLYTIFNQDGTIVSTQAYAILKCKALRPAVSPR